MNLDINEPDKGFHTSASNVKKILKKTIYCTKNELNASCKQEYTICVYSNELN